MRALQSLGRLRARAESRMLSRVIVRRRTGKTVQNEDTGRVYAVWEVVHSDLKCRLRSSTAGAGPMRRDGVPGGDLQTAQPDVDFPYATENLLDGDLYEFVVGENTGAVFAALEIDRVDQKTVRRVPVKAVTRPEEWDL